MKYSLIMTALFCTTLGAVPRPTPDALSQAKAEIVSFINAISKTSCEEYNVFVQHLPFYRSWGGYQTVAPAPYALEEQVTPAIKQLEEKIKAIVKNEKSFWQDVPANIAGGSSLSDKGHQFFAELITYTQQQPCQSLAPQATAQPKRKS